MTFILNRDFLAEIQKGGVEGHDIIHKFGRNPFVPNGTFAFMRPLGAFALLSAPTQVRVKAGGNVDDTAGGISAREVTVMGITAALIEESETIALSGASASGVTTKSFWRPHLAWVSGSGTYGAKNAGDIIIENAAGGTDLIQIEAEEGESIYGGFTIPQGKRGFILSLLFTVDGNKPAAIRTYTRAGMSDETAPFKSPRRKLYMDGILGSVFIQPRSPNKGLPALTDLWFEAKGDGGMTQASVAMELLLVDD